MLFGEQEVRIARRKYRWHKNGAKSRGIDFLFTFEEWYDFWLQSGHWHERGKLSGQYAMARHNDIGPYQLGNVCIISNIENNSFAHKGNKNFQFKSPVKGTCLTTGKEIILIGAKEMREAGFDDSCIYRCISGDLKTHKKHKWERI
jgi:hypothetical protein